MLNFELLIISLLFCVGREFGLPPCLLALRQGVDALESPISATEQFKIQHSSFNIRQARFEALALPGVRES